MSRTYRRGMVPLDCNCGAPIGWHWHHFDYGEMPSEASRNREIEKARRYGFPPDRCCRCWTSRKYDYYSKRNFKRDRKAWGKSPSWWKVMRERVRRAQIHDAMAHGCYDSLPRFHHDNDWDWN